MNAERLLAHYGQIGDAPDAIARLRRFILDLAVRGKLVPQDSVDEPASELLKRIAKEKARLVKLGEVRDKPALPAVAEEEVPFGVPATWRWVRFSNIVGFSAGRTPSRHDPSFWNTGNHAWVSIADMEDGQILSATKETVSDRARDRIFGSEPEAVGTIILSFKLTIGKIARLGIPAFHNEAIISIRPHLVDLDPYLFKVLPQFARQGDTKGAIKGATLNRDSISNILLPLPPLAEQRRIVAKIDELTALCDRLEAAQGSREAVRDRLAAASLARLNAPHPESLQADARFVLDALPALTARPDQIKQLRQTILNLAVRGKVVPQDASDEPASELLKRIGKEIAAYGKANRIAQTQADPIPDDDLPFAAPNGWEWTRLCALLKVITDGDHQPPPRADKGVAFLTIGNVTTGRLDFSGCRLVPEAYFKSLAPYRTPAKGDILYTVVGATYGRPALVETDRDFCVQRHIAILKPVGAMSLRFLLALLASPLIYDQATRSTTGTAQPTIALRPLRNFLAPLPPLAEQRRIVAKVDALMALCDRLEASLTTTAATRHRLLDALLAEALAPAEEREMEAAE
jgi:type I restriction enzyme, S subunit